MAEGAEGAEVGVGEAEGVVEEEEESEEVEVVESEGAAASLVGAESLL